MASFKKSISTNGTFKYMTVQNGNFVSTETGDIIDVAGIIESALGSGQVFDIKITQKDDVELDVRE